MIATWKVCSASDGVAIRERKRGVDRHLFFFFLTLKIVHRGVSRGLMCLLEPLIDGGARVVGALSTPLT